MDVKCVSVVQLLYYYYVKLIFHSSSMLCCFPQFPLSFFFFFWCCTKRSASIKFQPVWLYDAFTPQLPCSMWLPDEQQPVVSNTSSRGAGRWVRTKPCPNSLGVFYFVLSMQCNNCLVVLSLPLSGVECIFDKVVCCFVFVVFCQCSAVTVSSAFPTGIECTEKVKRQASHL